MNWYSKIKTAAVPPELGKVFDQQEPVKAFAEQVKNELGLQSFEVYLNSQGDLVLSSLIVPKDKREQGLGSAAVKRLTQFAQRQGKRIILTPGVKDKNWGTTSYNRLVKFYKRHGFVRNKGRNKDFRISEGMFWNPPTRIPPKQASTGVPTGLPPVLYHGTTAYAWKQKNPNGTLYLANDLKEAWEYAYHAAETDELNGLPAKPMVMAINTVFLAGFDLQPDWGGVEVTDQHTYQDTMKQFGSMAIQGDLESLKKKFTKMPRQQ